MLKDQKASFIGLIPFIVFITIFLGSGIYYETQGTELAFYQLKAPIAAFAAIITAFAIFKGTINEKFDTLIKGMGDSNIIIMCSIYLLAGAFGAVTSELGASELIVNLGLTYIPSEIMAVGIFVIALVLATSLGSSVSTIVLLSTIVFGIGSSTDLNTPLLLASLLGGAMFGDNLSIISDTTIAATTTQGVNMKDKFRVNILIAGPAALLTIICLLLFASSSVSYSADSIDALDLFKLLPYIIVLALAIYGLNVFAVLTIGFVLSGIIGIIYGNFSLIGFTNSAYAGFEDSFEIFLLSMFMGGLALLVTKAGGIQWILNFIKKTVRGRKSAEAGICALVALTDLATANNTVAIIIDGPVALDICNEYNVDKRKSAALLDIFSCIIQGIIPYGAQMLLLISATAGTVSVFEVLKYTWYLGFLFIFAVLAIVTPYVDNRIKNFK